jgi:hypothetical protein
MNANYIEPVRFTVTDIVSEPGEDDVYTVEEFLTHVKNGQFIDSDGFGHPVKEKLADPQWFIRPSELNIPEDATHVVWYNK